MTGSKILVIWWQVAYPELQRRQIDHARQKRWRLQAAHAFEGRAAPFGSLVDPSGVPGYARVGLPQGGAAQYCIRAIHGVLWSKSFPLANLCAEEHAKMYVHMDMGRS